MQVPNPIYCIDVFISLEKVDCEHKLKKLLAESDPPKRTKLPAVLQETNCYKQTVLHLAFLHRMPHKLILLIVGLMKLEDIDKQDATEHYAVDYLVSKTIITYILGRSILV